MVLWSCYMSIRLLRYKYLCSKSPCLFSFLVQSAWVHTTQQDGLTLISLLVLSTPWCYVWYVGKTLLWRCLPPNEQNNHPISMQFSNATLSLCPMCMKCYLRQWNAINIILNYIIWVLIDLLGLILNAIDQFY